MENNKNTLLKLSDTDLFDNSSFVQQINAEHAQLDTLLKELQICTTRIQAKFVLECLQQLWKQHSKTEFLHMRQHNYVSITGHALDHVNIANNLRSLQSEVMRPDYSILLENWQPKATTIREMLTWHFEMHDAEYARFQEQQKQTSPANLDIWF